MNVAGKSILVIDNNKKLSRHLASALYNEGIYINTVCSGREALNSIRYFPDLVILNSQLTDMSGFDLLRIIKEHKDLLCIPIFILSGNNAEVDEIVSLELGADYCVSQPVSIPLLKARIHALFRQKNQNINDSVIEEEEISIDKLRILIPQFTVICDEKYIELTKKEFSVIVKLAKNQGKVVTRQELLNYIKTHKGSSDKRIIDVYVTHIRKKLRGYAHYIETVPGVGYRIKIN